MVPDEVGIYNLALNAIGSRNNLSSTSERDRGAEVCRLWYPVVRDQVLAGAPWPSCKSFQRLGLKQARGDAEWVPGDPEPGYQFVYGSPSDMVQPICLTDFTRFTLTAYTDNTKVLNTNNPAPILAYTKRNYTVASWESALQMAIAFGLAANIAMPLTGKAQRANLLISQANDLIITARTEAANQGFDGHESIPDWISARGYANPGDERFYYPFGTLLTLGGN